MIPLSVQELQFIQLSYVLLIIYADKIIAKLHDWLVSIQKRSANRFNKKETADTSIFIQFKNIYHL